MKVRNSLAQEFKPLANQIGLLDRDSGNVAGRMRQTLNQAAANRIERNGKDNRNARFVLPAGWNGAAIGDNDVGFAPLEFSGNFADAIGSSRGPAILDRYSISLGPAALPHVR